MYRLVMLASMVSLIGCKQNLLEDGPDAALGVDAMDNPIPEGNFSCIGTPYPETAPDPVDVRGGVKVNTTPAGGITVEIYRSLDDVLIAQAVTDTTLGDRTGKYRQSVVTGGVAPHIYRKIVAANGRLDTYQYDGIPVSAGYDLWTSSFDETYTGQIYAVPGVTRDPAKGMLLFFALDCSIPPLGTHAVEGITVDAPPGATVVYGNDEGFLDAALTATGKSGEFVVLNVVPGFVDLTVHAGPLTYRTWPVRVHANSWTTGVRHP